MHELLDRFVNDEIYLSLSVEQGIVKIVAVKTIPAFGEFSDLGYLVFDDDSQEVE